ncbi:fungal fucose-specific lectin protein [Neofusicoccum parvum]|nr:fungal fucose-specific lectin protein [Neofusicoccum parvum]
MHAHQIQTPNLTLYFLDSSSRLRQLQTSNPDDTTWSLGSTDSDFNIPAASHLASYSCQDPSYPDYSNAWFQDSDGYYQIIDSSGGKTKVDNTLTSGVNMVKPPANASLAIVPHYMYDYNVTAKSKQPYVSLFYVNSDVLYEYHYYNGKFDWNRHFDASSEPRLPPTANMAAFSWGYNDTLASINGMQVLYTMPDSESGGVSIMTNKNNAAKWNSIDAGNSDNAFKGVARYSAIAATQAGRVYAVVEEGGKAELREWEYVPAEDRYQSNGPVNTDVA